MSATKIIEQAKSWLGCKESDGSHRPIINLYNNHSPLARNYKVTYTDSWCATFVSACAIKLGITNIIPTECSCGRMIQLMQNMGIWEESDSITPSSGDIIFYDWDETGFGDTAGWPEHVGIVTSVAGNNIVVIEGNKQDMVTYRNIKVGGKGIRGYGVPKYSDAVTTSNSENVSSTTDTTTPTTTQGTVDTSKLIVDGCIGALSVSRWQEIQNTAIDGIVSNQSRSTKQYHLGCVEGIWMYNDITTGSSLINSWQNFLNKQVASELNAEFGSLLNEDGKFGPYTIWGTQVFLNKVHNSNLKTDKYFGTLTASAFQTWMNTQ
ncbi:MAG: CHAP domain-containing protein [Eubacteriales bacterium]